MHVYPPGMVAVNNTGAPGAAPRECKVLWAPPGGFPGTATCR